MRAAMTNKNKTQSGCSKFILQSRSILPAQNKNLKYLRFGFFAAGETGSHTNISASILAYICMQINADWLNCILKLINRKHL